MERTNDTDGEHPDCGLPEACINFWRSGLRQPQSEGRGKHDGTTGDDGPSSEQGAEILILGFDEQIDRR